GPASRSWMKCLSMCNRLTPSPISRIECADQTLANSVEGVTGNGEWLGSTDSRSELVENLLKAFSLCENSFVQRNHSSCPPGRHPTGTTRATSSPPWRV